MTAPETAPLRGRCCLITGASGAFGGALARRLRQDGADLLLTGRSETALAALADNLAPLSEGTGRIATVAADLTSTEGFGRVVAAARSSEVRVLVNNAAIQGPIGPLPETAREEWEATIRLNLLVPVALCRALARLLAGDATRDRGKIINVSGGGATAARPNFGAYATAKTALARFTEILAAEAAPLHIDVNAVAPGAMASHMTREIAASGAGAAGAEEAADAAALLRVAAAPSERATALCSWLASPASDGISGRLLSALWDPWPELNRHAAILAASDVYTLRRIVPTDRGLFWPNEP